MSVSAEFLAEAQELIDSYSQLLLWLETQLRAGAELDPELLNAAFRALHTLKGLAGMVEDRMSWPRVFICRPSKE